MIKVLVTGASGFVGHHLIDLLLTNNVEIICTSREEYRGVYKQPFIKWFSVNITNRVEVFHLFSLVRPDVVFHLAGQSNVRSSWVDSVATFEANLIGTNHILDAVREYSPDCKIITIGSSEEYGHQDQASVPLSEELKPNPLNPYGLSKHAVSLLAQQYHKSYGLNVIHVRPFNHIGPGQAPGFVTSDFTKQICEIERGLKKNIIKVGNLNAERDFTDVRDIVRAYWELADRGIVGEVYNVCSGKSIRIADILQLLIEKSSVNIHVEIDEALYRPIDIPCYLGDCSKLFNHTGWKPEIPLTKTINDILEDWRNHILKE